MVSGLAGKLLGGKAGEGIDLLATLSKLGFKPEQIESFLPKALELIKSHLSPELVQKAAGRPAGDRQVPDGRSQTRSLRTQRRKHSAGEGAPFSHGARRFQRAAYPHLRSNRNDSGTSHLRFLNGRPGACRIKEIRNDIAGCRTVAVRLWRCRAIDAWVQDHVRAVFGNGFPAMPHDPRSSHTDKATPRSRAFPLEHRMLLSGTRDRSSGSSRSRCRAPTSASSRASSTSRWFVRRHPDAATPRARSRSISRRRTARRRASRCSEPQFTPVNESVTFPAGQATETVAVPDQFRRSQPGAGADRACRDLVGPAR